jgi:hypothetical protein
VVAGDTLEGRGGRLGLPHRLFTQDMALARRSIRRLAELDFETLCLSHYPPVSGSASDVLKAFASSLRD